jgi:hypothetical protein
MSERTIIVLGLPLLLLVPLVGLRNTLAQDNTNGTLSLLPERKLVIIICQIKLGLKLEINKFNPINRRE